MDHQTRNGGTNGNNTRRNNVDDDDEYINVYFMVGERRETATYRPDQVTDMELKELFRNAAEAGPLDIVKLHKGDKLLNISTHLPANTPDDPYNLQVVGAHLASTGMIEAEVLKALERRVSALERELRHHQESVCTTSSIALRELKRQVDEFRNKLETTEHLSWLGFYKQLPEPVSSEACRRLQYRRKSDSVKRRVREKFFNVCDVMVATNVREWLRSPAFDARQWEDEELLLMLQTMFVEFEFPQKFNIPLTTLRNFLYEVYNNYNEVPFHNFRHCFCVAQMMYAMACATNLAERIGDLEVLILIVSCICHDLDHPGYNNIYQINARTELALRYNDISPLENHHCSVAFRVLESPDCNIFASFDSSTFRMVREGIIRCILATDMARHNEILAQFTDAVPDFDYTNKAHINLLSMIMIKVADISNEARPMDVAEPWLDRLLQEFFKQSDAEKLEGLPVTPFMDRDKVTKPSSQCSFIGLVLLPLFEALGELLTELQELIVQPVREALEYYRRLNEAAKDERHHRKSIVDMGESTATTASMISGSITTTTTVAITSGPGSSSTLIMKSTSSHSMRSKRSTGTIYSRSRSTDEDNTENMTIEDADNIESSDPETATEVEISEKTLKFKISTEGTLSGCSAGRKSYPGSRKGSREKSSLDCHNHELARVVREHERERKKSRGENTVTSDLSSPISTKSVESSKILEELERDEILDDALHGTGNGIVESRSEQSSNNVIGRTSEDTNEEMRLSRRNDKDGISRCCCCDDKTNTVNHKSLFSRLRNFTDRLSISFDSKEPPHQISKLSKNTTVGVKCLNKSNSVSNSSSVTSSPKYNNSSSIVCKRCNLKKSTIKEKSIVVELPIDEKAMTLPKVKKSQDSRNKNWKTVFAKEKRSSSSLESLVPPSTRKHRRNFSNPEGEGTEVGPSKIEFKEIDIRKQQKPEIIVNPDSATSCVVDDDEIGKFEIRRSSASMEDISKITKQTEGLMLGSLEQKKAEEMQHTTGSLDSMLYKESEKTRTKKPVVFSSPAVTKKSSPGLFSRFKSGMSIDSGKSTSNSGSLDEQRSQTGWISSLTASFRPKRQSNENSPQPPRSPSREEVK